MNKSSARIRFRLDHPQRRSGGFSLIELLIAVTLGLLLLVAVSSIFLGSRRSFRTGEGVAQVQESGRFANLLIAPVVRQAGYLPDPVQVQLDPTATYRTSLNKTAVFGFENTQPAAGVYANFTPSSADYVPGTDVLVIAFVGKNPTVPVADSPLKTCLGDDVDDTHMAVNIFYIGQPAGALTPSLYCSTNIGLITDNANVAGVMRSEPLVQGITDMQITYGIDTNADFSSTNRYVAADAVTDWTLVSSVRIRFTVDSADAVERGRADTSAVNGVISGRIRRTFNTTFDIRNRLR